MVSSEARNKLTHRRRSCVSIQDGCPVPNAGDRTCLLLGSRWAVVEVGLANGKIVNKEIAEHNQAALEAEGYAALQAFFQQLTL